MTLSFKQKILLALLLITSAFLSLNGGFRVNHIDTEYHKTLYNKSYFLHNIYHLTSKFEFEIKKIFLKENKFIQAADINKFKTGNQRHGISLYLVNGFFALLGIYICFRLAYLLCCNFWLSYLAAWILSSSYFWNAEAHYPTTDIPLSSIILSTLYFLFENFINKKESSNEDMVYEGLILGACCAVKYAGFIILAPYFFFKYKNQELKKTIIPLITAFVFIAISISDKFKQLLEHLMIEYKVQTEEGWAGYNVDEPGLIYHIKHSLIEEYGLTLTLLAILGIIYFYKKTQDDKQKRLIFLTILAFMSAHLILISSTIIKTVRFALPLIPILSIFSAFGIYQIYLIIKKTSPNLSKIVTTILIIFSTAPALKNTLSHNHMMINHDTADFVMALRNIIDKQGAINILLDDKQLFDKTPNLDDGEYLRRCISEPKDFQKIFKFEKYPNLIVSTNSYKLDRFIFDKTYHCENGHKAFKNYENLKVLQINPFKVDKRLVPFSFISNFSPRKPDLKYRNYKGGFFELYYMNPAFEASLRNICEQNKYPCNFVTGKDSYFLSEIQTSFVDPKVRSEIQTKLSQNQ